MIADSAAGHIWEDVMYRLFFVFLFLIPVCANAQPTNNPAASLRPITPLTCESAESFKARAAELAKQAEEMRQENKKKNDAFWPLLEAAGLQAKAPWQLVGIDVWIAGQGRFTRRMGQLYIRVNSADRAQILLTTLRVVQDIIDAN